MVSWSLWKAVLWLGGQSKRQVWLLQAHFIAEANPCSSVLCFSTSETRRNALPQESWAADASRGTVSVLND